jgi:hypothetical protein
LALLPLYLMPENTNLSSNLLRMAFAFHQSAALLLYNKYSTKHDARAVADLSDLQDNEDIIRWVYDKYK